MAGVDRSIVVGINNEISRHAGRKELTEALALFETLKKENGANSHTYAAILNAYVRCGDMDGAKKIVDEIRDSKRFKLDVISYTTLMKGFCAVGDIVSATALLHTMTTTKPVVMPNIRTMNTFLRGCVLTGSIKEATTAFENMKTVYKVAADISAYEYVIMLLSQGLHLEQALPMAGRIKGEECMKSGITAIYISIARAAALLGDFKLVKKALTTAKEHLPHVNADSEETAPAAPQTASSASSASEDAEAGKRKVAVAGGKRAWKTTVDESRADSLAMFREHKLGELNREIETIAAYMASMQSAKGSVVLPVSYFLRVLSFSWIAATEAVSRPQLIDALVAALCDRFGLSWILKKLAPSSPATAVSATTAAPKAVATTNKKPVKGSVSTEVAAAAASVAASNHPDTVPTEPCTTGTAIDASDAEKPVAAAVPTEAAEESKSKKRRDREKQKQKEKKAAAAAANTTTTSTITTDSSHDTTNATAAVAVLVPLSSQATLLAAVRRQVEAIIDEEGRINFSSLFSSQLEDEGRETTAASAVALAQGESKEANSSSGSSSSSGSVKPVKIEICSGAGEWVAAQASADKGSNWIAMELRHDRVYQTFTRAAFARATNLAILGGDAMTIIPRHVSSASVSLICVNHPEPPQQSSLELTSQAKHLLDERFLSEASRVLAQDGMLTIVTDNRWYSRFLAKSFSRSFFVAPQGSLTPLTQRLACQLGVKGAEYWNINNELDGIEIFEGKPGPDCGHCVEASSYFDRMWKRSNLVERYFIVLRKCTVSGSAYATTGIGAQGRSGAGAGAMKRTGSVVVSASFPQPGVVNKKMKFSDDDE